MGRNQLFLFLKKLWDESSSRSCVWNRAAPTSCPAAATAGQRNLGENGKPSLGGAAHILKEVLKREGAVSYFSKLPLCTEKAKGFSWLSGPLHPSHHLLGTHTRLIFPAPSSSSGYSPVPYLSHSAAFKKTPVLWFAGKGRLVEDYSSDGRSRVKVTLKFRLRFLGRRIQFEWPMLLLPSPRKWT